MAKRNRRTEHQKENVTYKDLARARREKKLRRQTLMAVGALVAVIMLILVTGIVNELVVKPGQPVAKVGDTEISTKSFQERVRLERSQTISLIEQYAELLGVEQVYGIAAQLDEYEAVGEQVLDGMIDELLVRQGAQELGVIVSDEDVSRALEEREGFYRDGTPTPRPTSSPWPTATPITPTDTLPTPLPSLTPRPTPTLVTQDAFDESYQSQIRDLKKDGINQDTYRKAVEYQLLVENVREQLLENVPDQVDQVQLDTLIFSTREIADEYLARLKAGEPFDALKAEANANAEDEITSSPVSWTPYEEMNDRWGTIVAQLAFALEPDSLSEIAATNDGRFVIFRVLAREERELSSSILQSRQEKLYTEWLDGLREATPAEKFDNWRQRVPKDPAIDPLTLMPTATSETQE